MCFWGCTLRPKKLFWTTHFLRCLQKCFWISNSILKYLSKIFPSPNDLILGGGGLVNMRFSLIKFSIGFPIENVFYWISKKILSVFPMKLFYLFLVVKIEKTEFFLLKPLRRRYTKCSITGGDGIFQNLNHYHWNVLEAEINAIFWFCSTYSTISLVENIFEICTCPPTNAILWCFPTCTSCF